MFDRILEFREWFTKPFVELFNSLGINPLYGATIFCVCLLLTHIKDFKNWNNIPDYKKSFIKSALFGTIILIIGSISNLVTGFLD